jgi:1,4-dihydroxy-2-naphthoate octaprenyltransferase
VARRRALLWLLWAASRPAQLLLVLGVYALGVKAAAVLGASVDPQTVLAGAGVLVPVAASVHYANEYADHETDTLTDRTPFSGGSGALAATGLPRSTLLGAALGALAVGTALAGAAAAVGYLNGPALGLLAAIAAFGWQYSVGPLRLAWRGFGEVTNAALGGLALPAYAAATVDGPAGTVALASVPFFLVVLLNLFATQWPDREADAAVGKRTLAVRWSPGRLRRVYTLVGVAAGGSVLALHPAPLATPVALGSLVAVPPLALGWLGYTRREVPWPTVAGMVALAAGQFAGWCLV